MLNALERYRVDFAQLQDQIEECVGISPDEQEWERGEHEDSIVRIEAHLRDLQLSVTEAGQATIGNDTTMVTSNSRAASMDLSTHATIKLPEIKITTFDGEWENWLSFKNVFTELIHNNQQLTDAQRFYYLQSYVIAGSAKQYIDLPLTAENYSIAWKQLRDHFDESRIVKKHVKGLYELKKCQEDSAPSLQTLIDGIWKNFHALKALRQPVDQWDALLTHLILTKLDARSRGEVEKAAPSDRLQTFTELMTLLADRVRILEAVSSVEPNKAKSKVDKSSKSLVAMNALPCSICKGEHAIFRCKSFLDMTPQLRLETVRKRSLCYNCLTSAHTKQDCKAGNCRICHKRHHTLLHLKTSASVNQSTPQASNVTTSSTETDASNAGQEIKTQPTTACSLHVNYDVKPGPVLLASAIVKIHDSCGREYLARALLDGGKTGTLWTGINCTRTATNTSVHATIRSRLSNFTASSEFLITDKITGDLPQQEITVLKIPNHMQLADPHFNVPNRVDILIGADIFWELLT
ncbi:PREDICTED: uncharacterized protein LOC105558010, partial [Vollenhovia emeryi]|uniref:uncharacterized protein LOC105558010 n=1 Tax=Vollenhovia emeryi TaxID=411798 RepID=UPI0005F545FF